MGTQASNDWVSTTALEFEDAAATTDALAIAPYFGGRYGSPAEYERVVAMDLDALFADITTVALPRSATWIAEQRAVADAAGVTLISYEGGQHLAGVGSVGMDDTINALFDAANRDPRMGAAYAAHLADWREAGGQLFVHFSDCSRYGRYGRWGAVEDLAQVRDGTAPKYDALMGFIDANERWW